MTFTPNPINTTSVELETGIAGLTEQLARNTHDLWARRRMDEGWRYGPERDDRAKTHPGLVAYDELTDGEREYDRQTAIGALRAITALGYRIEPAPRLGPLPPDRIFEERLQKELGKASRHDDFDMNDTREIAMTECHDELTVALRWLAGNVSKEWIAADKEAKRNQKLHRHLARTAIFAGMAAIVFAILQLAVQKTAPQFTDVAGLLEAIAVFGALLAVVVGVFARINRRWLGYRHRAESLRMLKFRALDRLWLDTGDAWKAWVEAELRKIPAAADFYLNEKWSEKSDFADEEPGPPRFHDDAFARAVIAYYRVKRLAHQRRYFKRFAKIVKETQPWQHISLWLFFASIACVLFHFGLEWIANHRVIAPPGHHRIENVAVWFVAFAAIIPVVGSGIRAWFAAFELTRSANLYEEKLRAIDRAAAKLDQDDLWAIRREVAITERSLREEHYEWLRLLRDAEWFL